MLGKRGGPRSRITRSRLSQWRCLMMRSLATLLAAAGLTVAAWSPTLAAGPVGPTLNTHNCGGSGSFTAIQAIGGHVLGQLVAAAGPTGTVPVATGADCYLNGVPGT